MEKLLEILLGDSIDAHIISMETKNTLIEFPEMSMFIHEYVEKFAPPEYFDKWTIEQSYEGLSVEISRRVVDPDELTDVFINSAGHFLIELGFSYKVEIIDDVITFIETAWEEPTSKQVRVPKTKPNPAIPNMVMPLIRRVFPALVAHQLVSVQPMHTPAGIAIAQRFFPQPSGTTSAVPPPPAPDLTPEEIHRIIMSTIKPMRKENETSN